MFLIPAVTMKYRAQSAQSSRSLVWHHAERGSSQRPSVRTQSAGVHGGYGRFGKSCPPGLEPPIERQDEEEAEQVTLRLARMLALEAIFVAVRQEVCNLQQQRFSYPSRLNSYAMCIYAARRSARRIHPSAQSCSISKWLTAADEDTYDSLLDALSILGHYPFAAALAKCGS